MAAGVPGRVAVGRGSTTSTGVVWVRVRPASARPPTAATTPTAPAVPVQVRKVRRSAAPRPGWGSGAGVPAAAPAAASAGRRCSRSERVTLPAAAAPTAANTVTAWSARGSRSPAIIPRAATTPKATGPTQGRRRAAGPTRAPRARQITTMVVMSTGLSEVPRASMPVRTRVPGAWSMTSPPTDPTSDWPWLPVADTSSPMPRATPAATTPASRARLRVPVDVEVVATAMDPCNTMVPPLVPPGC